MIANNIELPNRMGIFCDTCGECALEGFKHQSYGESIASDQGWHITTRTVFGRRRTTHTCPDSASTTNRRHIQVTGGRGPSPTHVTMIAVAAALVSLNGTAQTLGKGGTIVDGTTGLAHCERSIGSVALVEEKRATTPEAALPPQFAALIALSQRQRGGNPVDPIPLLKLLTANSGCFQVVDRGEGFAALQREREIANAGQMKPGSGVGGQQLQSADYLLTAQLVYQDSNAGGGYGGLGGLAPGGGALIGLRSKKLEAQALLTLVAVRSGVQVAAATGSARKRDIGVIGGGLATLGIGALGGGYTSTDMGKITSAAFLDAYNKLVAALPAPEGRSAAGQVATKETSGGQPGDHR